MLSYIFFARLQELVLTIFFILFTDILQTDLHTIEPIHSDGKTHYDTTSVLMIAS